VPLATHFFTFVEMQNTCQVTNQSSHGELSFHHNPHLRLCWGLGLSTFRVIRRGGSRLKHAAHPICCHCCELCALKQKPGVLLEFNNQKKPKSQLQTVLITASGPQALNALVHRERYTQGSRQNRCVSSQEALALRAKVMGNREDQCLLCCPPFVFSCIRACLLCTVAVTVHAVEGYLSEGRVKNVLPHGASVVRFRSDHQKIANSELLTAGNPTV
jgi:hypothetical protein